jgi:hypothetical protein
MSKEPSAKHTPWYRAYRRDQWDGPRTTIPEARDIFGDETISELLKEFSLNPSPKERAEFQANLREIAESYVCAALNTPLGVGLGPKDVTLSKRANWVDRHLVKPSRDLIRDLSDADQPRRSEWPDTITAPIPDLEVLVAELDKLLARSEILRDSLRDRSTLGNSHTTEFKTDLSLALAEALGTHFPYILDARGIGKTDGRLAHYLRRCFQEIFPNDKRLSNKLIAQVIKLLKLN